MHMNNKSQGLSINVIIIVAIALIVLVVMIAIFTGRLGSFVSGIDKSQTCTSTCSALGMQISDSAQLADEAASCRAADRNRYIGGDLETYADLIGTQGCCCKPYN